MKYENNTKIINWAINTLLSLGYKLDNNIPEVIQNTPWSNVIRFKTSHGYVYLKHMPKNLALEAPIIELLFKNIKAAVPNVIAKNNELDCFLMEDAGISLRTILKKQFDINIACKAVEQFMILQISAVSYVRDFMKIGVPDWRLDKLSEIFSKLLLEKELLINDGLSEEEIKTLENLIPIISKLCNKLSCYSVQESIVQCDFHDNNILVDTKSHKLTNIDLGEIVISHPLFSLIGFLNQMKKHYGLQESDEKYQNIKNAGLKKYENDHVNYNKLLNAFDEAKVLWIIYESLGQYRLIQACDRDAIMSYQRGKLSRALREFISIQK